VGPARDRLSPDTRGDAGQVRACSPSPEREQDAPVESSVAFVGLRVAALARWPDRREPRHAAECNGCGSPRSPDLRSRARHSSCFGAKAEGADVKELTTVVGPILLVLLSHIWGATCAESAEVMRNPPEHQRDSARAAASPRRQRGCPVSRPPSRGTAEESVQPGHRFVPTLPIEMLGPKMKPNGDPGSPETPRETSYSNHA
jgi:hypothetical protein